MSKCWEVCRGELSPREVFSRGIVSLKNVRASSKGKTFAGKGLIKSLRRIYLDYITATRCINSCKRLLKAFDVLISFQSWEGMSVARKKNGEYFVQNMKIIPIIGSNG